MLKISNQTSYHKMVDVRCIHVFTVENICRKIYHLDIVLGGSNIYMLRICIVKENRAHSKQMLFGSSTETVLRNQLRRIRQETWKNVFDDKSFKLHANDEKFYHQ